MFSLPGGLRVQSRVRVHQVAKRAEEPGERGATFSGVRRILVTRTEPLGSLVLALPAVAALRCAYPSAWLGLLVRPSTAPLARLVSGVDQVLEDAADSDRLSAVVKAFRADLFVSMSAGGRIPWAAATARVRHRVGPGGRVYSALFERRVDERGAARDRHEVEVALAHAHRCGAEPGPASFPIAIPAAAAESARMWLGEHGIRRPFVVIRAQSAGASCPPWPEGHFVRLATLLAAEGVQVVFSIGPAEDATSRLLDGADLPARRMARFTGDLATLPAFVQAASLVIGNGTGPLHLAAALGTPTLFFQPPWSPCGPARWGPYASNGFSLVPEMAGGEPGRARERAEWGNELMAGISPATALSCSLAILDGRAPTP